jgi:hypothetical protein
MRLSILDNGRRPVQKIFLRIVRLVSGRVVGPVLVMSYRKELFGKYLAACIQEAMRGGKAWSVGEVELFAAFVSKLNQCSY